MTILWSQRKQAADLAWENGDIPKAREISFRTLTQSPGDNKAKHLSMKCSFAEGKFKEALETFQAIDKSYFRHKECVELAIYANIHLHEYNNAFQLAKQGKIREAACLEDYSLNKFQVSADKTYVVPFSEDDQISSDNWPGIAGTINGLNCLIRFDSGGNYIVAGMDAARRLGLSLKCKHSTLHGSAKVSGWYSTIDSMTFDRGPAFRNVPVLVMESLGDYIVFGTNILEQFLTTVDYHTHRFILSPRNNPELAEEHYKMLPAKQTKMSFYILEDHFMIGKGKFASHDNLNFLFDSGLIALTEIAGKLVQAPFNVSKAALVRWGFEKSNLTKNTFIPTSYSLEVAGLIQANTLIWYDNNLKKDRNFGGIRIDGLISHAWLKNYTWTIDFDKMEYTFGENK